MSDQQKAFEYILHEEHGIHEFRHYESSRESVDESVVALDRILGERVPDDPAPLLILSNTQESGDQPISYAMSQYRAQMQKHGQEKVQGTHIALLTQGGAMISFWTSLFNIFRAGLVLQPFTEHEDALDWLGKIHENYQNEAENVVTGS